MKHQKYIITTAIGDTERSSVWSPEKPKKLGYELPWTVLQSKGSTIRIQHRSGQAWDVKDAYIKKYQEIELPDPDKKISVPVKFKIRALDAIEAPYQSAKGAEELPADGKWRVYACSGEHVAEIFTVFSRFVARHQGTRVFTLVKSAESFQIKIHDPHARLVGLKGSGEVAGVETQEVTIPANQLPHISVEYKSRSWKFSKVRDSEALPPMRFRPDEDLRRFKQSSFMAAAALLLMIFGSLVISKTDKEEETEKKLQVAKIIFKKRPTPTPLPSSKVTQSIDLSEKVVPKKDLRGQKVAQAPVTEPKQRADASPAQPPKPLKVAEARRAQTPTPKVGAKPLPSVGSKLTKKVVKKRESKAVRQAKSLKKSLSGLLSGLKKKKSLVRGRKGRSRQKNGGSLLSKTSSKMAGAGDAVVDTYNPQDVEVGFTDGGGGKKGALSYRTRAANSGRDRSGGGKFLAVAGDPNGSGTSVDSGLTKSEVFAVINRHMSEVRYCYERAILRRPDVEGKLMVNFTIGNEGKVTVSSVKASTLSDRSLDECVMGRLEQWKFPSPKGGADVAVTYPFVFRRL